VTLRTFTVSVQGPPSGSFTPVSGFGLSGTVGDGNSVTITGSGFGANGPEVVLFDDFAGGTTGAAIPMTSPKVGTWTTTGGSAPVYSATPYGNNPRSFSIANTAFAYSDGNSKRNLIKAYADTANLFISYAVKFNNGWAGAPEAGRFKEGASPYFDSGADSTWKFVWASDGTPGLNDGTDPCMPTIPAGGLDNLVIGGNIFNLGGGYMMKPANSRFSFTDWTVVQAGLKLQPFGSLSTLHLATSHPGQSGTVSATRTDAGVPSGRLPQTSRINFPGWFGNFSSAGYPNGFDPVYSNIYVARGTGAWARVLIGNASTIATCSQLALCTPTNWAGNSITVNLRFGPFTSLSGKYLFVYDENNAVQRIGQFT
jgi:hypothetical protein